MWVIVAWCFAIAGIVFMIYMLVYIVRVVPKLGAPCALVTDPLLPDACIGTCPAATKTFCQPVTTRPYLIWWTQAATCGCLPPLPPLIPPGLTPTPTP